MGAVHGVYLKYVGLSALSYAGYTFFAGEARADEIVSQTARSLAMAIGSTVMPFSRLIPAAIFGYSAAVNGMIAVLFKLERGMGLIGKNKKTGQIPTWSYIVYFPFHVPTMLYTYIHTIHGSTKVKTPDGETKKVKVPVASEVQPGWWVGGCYAHQLDKDWGGIVDVTVEFPERCIDRSHSYLSCPSWDGVPATPAELEECATYAVEARKKGDVIVHCAHGRGRSTTVMCACLVKAGLYMTWQEAFEKGIKPGRSVCKLNGLMKKALTAWQEEYVDGKKAL
jgi:hypothetical protein